MKKADIIKALNMCGNLSDIDGCEGCPYEGIHHCDGMLCNDAATLIKANSATPKYTFAAIFTKRTNLSAYCNDQVYRKCGSDAGFEAMRKYYAKERDVQLIALFRYDGNKAFCKIKCPINPLPVKGEFEVPSTIVVMRFLEANGWNFKQKFYPRMFE